MDSGALTAIVERGIVDFSIRVIINNIFRVNLILTFREFVLDAFQTFTDVLH